MLLATGRERGRRSPLIALSRSPVRSTREPPRRLSPCHDRRRLLPGQQRTCRASAAPTLGDDLVQTRRGNGADGSGRFRPGLTATAGTPGQSSRCAIASAPSAPAAAHRVTPTRRTRRLVRAGPGAIRGGPRLAMEEPRRGGARRYRFTEGPAALALRIPEVPHGAGGTAKTGTPSGTRLPSATLGVFQVLDSQYGMYVWPSAVVLAQYLWVHRSSLPGKRVLEVPLSGPANTPLCSAAGAASPFLPG